MWAIFKSSTLNKILTIVTIISTIVAIWGIFWGSGKADDARRYKATLYQRTVEYQDELGRKVTEVTQLEATAKELKTIAKKDSAKLSAYEKKLLNVYNELNANNRKIKNTEMALLFSEQSKDSFAVQLQELDSMRAFESKGLPLKYGRYDGKWASQDFVYDPNTDSLFTTRVDENEFFVDMYKQKELRPNGKPYFFLLRWFKDWEYRGSIKSLKDSTTIKDAVMVHISKR